MRRLRRSPAYGYARQRAVGICRESAETGSSFERAEINIQRGGNRKGLLGMVECQHAQGGENRHARWRRKIREHQVPPYEPYAQKYGGGLNNARYPSADANVDIEKNGTVIGIRMRNAKRHDKGAKRYGY